MTANGIDKDSVVVGMPLSYKLKSHGRQVLVVVCLLLLLVAGISVRVWRQHATAQNSLAEADNRQFKSVESLVAVDEANNQYGKVASVWASYATTTSNKTHKESALLDAAAAYISNGQYAQAVNMCKMAEAVDGVTFEEAEVAATAYSALGDKQNAIHYYHEAISLMPASLSDGPAEKVVFKKAIQELQTGS